jgi:hypothetical protein
LGLREKRQKGCWEDREERVYTSTNTIVEIKIKKRSAGHVACMGEIRGVYRGMWEKSEERRRF